MVCKVCKMFANVWKSACFTLLILSVAATVDINLSELEYISDHLTSDECRRLVAALHNRGYRLNAHFAEAERKVPRDVSCLNMLMHWNSRLGEGRGQTHTVLTHRLKQINRKDLATWLSQASFHQLAEDLDNSLLKDPFKDIVKEPNGYEKRRGSRQTSLDEPCLNETGNMGLNGSNSTENGNGTKSVSFFGMLTNSDDENYLWNLMDLVGFALLLMIAFATLIILARFLCLYGCRCQVAADGDGGKECRCSNLDRGSTSMGPSSIGGMYGSWPPGGGNDTGSYEMNQPAAKKKEERKKKKKKESKSNKSMVCKTVEYRADGTVEEIQLLLSDASETDFDRAVAILASPPPDDPPPEMPPPGLNGRRDTNNSRQENGDSRRDSGNKGRGYGSYESEDRRWDRDDGGCGNDSRRYGNDSKRSGPDGRRRVSDDISGTRKVSDDRGGPRRFSNDMDGGRKLSYDKDGSRRTSDGRNGAPRDGDGRWGNGQRSGQCGCN